MSTIDQAQEVKRLLTRLHLWGKKDEVVESFSFEGRTRLHELDDNETAKLLEWLVKKDGEAQKMRKRMLSIGYQLHWDKPRTQAEQMMEAMRINFNHVNDFLEKDTRSKLKKKMTSMDPYELTQALQQMEEILKATKKQATRHA